VDVTPTTPAAVVPIPLKQALALRTVRGTVAELVARADEFGDDLLRVFVCEPTRAGLREEVQEVLPNALQVRIESDYASPVNARRHDVTSGTDRSPGDLFADYCDANAVVDDDVRALFGSLHDLATSATDGREQS
jgi:exonuclease SbcD